LVELAPNRGAQVAQWSDAEIGDIFELRILLEGYAVRRAAERGIDESAGLLELCDAMEQRLHKLDRRSYDEITEINMRFHRALYRSAGSRMLSALLSGVIQVPLVRHTFHHYTPHELNRSFSQHRDLIEAINARDGAWAEAIMHSHILAGQAALERSANEQVKPTDRTPSGGEEPS
jgi:DNA-binding GntR family transcriptional regulator